MSSSQAWLVVCILVVCGCEAPQIDEHSGGVGSHSNAPITVDTAVETSLSSVAAAATPSHDGGTVSASAESDAVKSASSAASSIASSITQSTVLEAVDQTGMSQAIPGSEDAEVDALNDLDDNGAAPTSTTAVSSSGLLGALNRHGVSSSAASSSSVQSNDTALRAPSAFKMAVLGTTIGTECGPMPVPYTGELAFPSKYEGSDSARDTLNLEAEQRYLELTATIKELERLASSWSDQYLGGDLAARACALDLIELWAVNRALLHGTINGMGQSVRKWALATLANSYLQLTQPVDSKPLPGATKAIIEGWFSELADSVKAYYSDRPLDKVNNHDYWAAWAVMAVAVSTNRRDLFDWSLVKFHEAIGQIDSSGYLPNELKRESRALSYHNFALQPLVWLAVFAQTNGKGLDDLGRAELQALVSRTVEGLENPAIFRDLTGQEQEVDGLVTSYNLAWMEVWGSTFPLTEAMEIYLHRLRPMRSTRSGGNVSLLFRAAKSRAN